MVLISVYDGPQMLETRECRLAQLADGRRAAIYRGLAFPLLPSGVAIDVSGEAHSAESAPLSEAGAESDRPYAVIAGADAAYVLLAGSNYQADEAAKQLNQAGFEIIRTGRYLGDPVNGFVADWFVRIATPPHPEALDARLAALFGRALVAPESAADLRMRLLAGELASARERARRSEEEADRFRVLLAERSATSTEIAALQESIAVERRRREIAESNASAALAELEAAATTATPSTPPIPQPAPKRVLDEIIDVLAALMPRVRLVGGSLDAVAIEFADRRALYRVLAELQACETAMPQRWKTVQGVDGWIEHSKIANGVDSQGRIYARLDRSDRSWDVLVSHKSSQDRDINWLKKQ